MAISRLAQPAVPLSVSFSLAITCRELREIFLDFLVAITVAMQLSLARIYTSICTQTPTMAYNQGLVKIGGGKI